MRCSDVRQGPRRGADRCGARALGGCTGNAGRQPATPDRVAGTPPSRSPWASSRSTRGRRGSCRCRRRHRDAVRDRRRRPGGRRRRPVELPGRGAEDRPLRATSRTSRRSPATSPTSWSSPTTPTDRASSARQAEDPGRPGAGAPRRSTTSTPQIEQLGALTGHADEAAELVDADDRPTSQLVADVRSGRAADLLPRARRHLLLGDVEHVHRRAVRAAGLKNIADAADRTRQAATRSCRPSTIVAGQPRPDLPRRHQVLRADAETVAARPGWARRSPRCKNGSVVELDDDIASRWGPRIVDLLRAVVDAVGQGPAVTPRRRMTTRPAGAAPAPVAVARARRRPRARRRGGRWLGDRSSAPCSSAAVGWRSGRCRCRPRSAAVLGVRRRRRAHRAQRRHRRRAAAAPGGARRRSSAAMLVARRRRLPGRVPQPAGRPVPARRRRPAPGSGATARRSPCGRGGTERRAVDRCRWPRSPARWARWCSPTCWASPAGRDRSPATLLLAGVAVAAFLTAVQTFVLQRNRTPSARCTPGSSAGWPPRAGTMCCCVAAVRRASAARAARCHRRQLDVLRVGDEEAAQPRPAPGARRGTC